MLNPLLVGALTLVSVSARQIDTTFAVPQNARVTIENQTGTVDVRVWERNAVRVVADHASGDRVRIQQTGSTVRIESAGRYGAPREVDYEVTIPATAALRINGPFTDISVRGAGGDVIAETVRGDVDVHGGNGLVELRSVEGDVTLEAARGRISLSAVNEDVRGTNLAGDVTVEAVNGDIDLIGINSDNVVATTVNGDVTYDGTIRGDGRYSLTTHNGDVSIGVPQNADATISIATFNGDIDSYLPIMLTEFRRNRRLTFTVGQGTANIELESFNGTIRLRQPARR